MVVSEGIVLIGAGNVATHLGAALRRAGYDVKQVYSRTEASARTLAERLDTAWTTCLDEVRADAGLYIVSIKDSAFGEVLPQLTRRNASALYVHTAGSMPLSVWEGLADRYGVLYPLQTFSRRREVDFSEVPFFVEANSAEDTGLLCRLARELSKRVFMASTEQRGYLHIAAVFACNFTNHLYALCQELLAKHDLPFEVMLPLIDETARKVHELSPAEAQTGPAVRYDENVISHHLQLLADRPDLAKLYELLSKDIFRSTLSPPSPR